MPFIIIEQKHYFNGIVKSGGSAVKLELQPIFLPFYTINAKIINKS